MELFKFASQQYQAFGTISVQLYNKNQPARRVNDREMLAKTYAAVKPIFVQLLKNSTDYKPRSLLEKALKPIVLSLLNLALTIRIAHINHFLTKYPVNEKIDFFGSISNDPTPALSFDAKFDPFAKF